MTLVVVNSGTPIFVVVVVHHLKTANLPMNPMESTSSIPAQATDHFIFSPPESYLHKEFSDLWFSLLWSAGGCDRNGVLRGTTGHPVPPAVRGVGPRPQPARAAPFTAAVVVQFFYVSCIKEDLRSRFISPLAEGEGRGQRGDNGLRVGWTEHAMNLRGEATYDGTDK